MLHRATARTQDVIINDCVALQLTVVDYLYKLLLGVPVSTLSFKEGRFGR